VPQWMRDADSDDEEQEWPVLLAWLERTGPKEYKVDPLQCLPYARVVANAVQSCSIKTPPEPSDKPSTVPPAPVASTRIDLARNIGSSRRRVAVAAADANGVLRDRLQIDSDRSSTFIGSVTVIPKRKGIASHLVLRDDSFTAEDIKDPDGLICFIRSSALPAARFVATALAGPRSERSWRAVLDSASSTGDHEKRAALAKALNSIVNAQVKGFRGKQELFDPRPLGAIELRKDTWSALADADAATPVSNRRTTMLVLADLLSAYVDVPRNRRRGSPVLALGPMATPAAARRWSIYRTDLTQDDSVTRQLRFEIAAPPSGAAPESQRFVIGCTTDEGFDPCLTVDAAGTVTLTGKLDVKGRLVQAPREPDPSDPDFAEEIAKAWAAGTVGGIAAVSTIKIDLSDLTKAQTGTKWPYKVKVTNDGADPITDVALFEGLGINAQIVMPRPIGAFATIGAGDTKTIDVTHDVLTAPAGGQITVAIGATARGSALGLMVGGELKTVAIVS